MFRTGLYAKYALFKESRKGGNTKGETIGAILISARGSFENKNKENAVTCNKHN